MRRIGNGVNRVGLRAEPDPAGAPDKFFGAETDAFATVPRHHFGNFGRGFGWCFGRQFFFAQMVLLEKSAVIEQHEQLWFALYNDGEIRMSDEHVFADVKPRAAPLARSHDE